MVHEDFDIDSLAAYLHLTPAQVSRLADRDKIPGRKVSGQWRFSQAEIHHWLEDRIGVSDDGELVEMETVLNRHDKSADESVSVTDLLSLDAVAVPLHARTRNSVLSEMSKLAEGTGLLWDKDKMAEALRAREELHPTALDNGVALLHPRRPMSSILAEPFLALGRTYQGIPFGGGSLTDIFFLICSVDDRSHLKILARVSRLVSDDKLLSAIREAEDAATVLQAIQDTEAKIS